MSERPSRRSEDCYTNIEERLGEMSAVPGLTKFIEDAVHWLTGAFAGWLDYDGPPFVKIGRGFAKSYLEWENTSGVQMPNLERRSINPRRVEALVKDMVQKYFDDRIHKAVYHRIGAVEHDGVNWEVRIPDVELSHGVSRYRHYLISVAKDPRCANCAGKIEVTRGKIKFGYSWKCVNGDFEQHLNRSVDESYADAHQTAIEQYGL